MAKKVKVVIAVCFLLGFFITVINVYAMTYCDTSRCIGLCGCEGEVSPHGEDPCCFECEHWSGPIVCCEGIHWIDGCLTYEH